MKKKQFCKFAGSKKLCLAVGALALVGSMAMPWMVKPAMAATKVYDGTDDYIHNLSHWSGIVSIVQGGAHSAGGNSSYHIAADGATGEVALYRQDIIGAGTEGNEHIEVYRLTDAEAKNILGGVTAKEAFENWAGGSGDDANTVTSVKAGNGVTVTKGGTTDAPEYTVAAKAGNGITVGSGGIAAKAGTNVTVDGNGINVNGTGTVASGNTGLINGGTAYNELRPADGNYIKKNNTTAANLKALDDKIGAANVANGTYIKTGNTVNANLKALDDQIGSLDSDGNYIKKDDNVSENLTALDDALKDVVDTGLTFGANSGDDTVTKLGSKVSFLGGGSKDDGEYEGKNIKTKVSQDGDGNTQIEVMFDKNPEFASIKTEGDANIGGNLNVDGDSHLKGDLQVDGDANLKNTVVDGTLTVSDDAVFEKYVEVRGDQLIKGDLTVEGDSNLKNTVVDGTLDVKDDAHLYKNLQVDGDTNIGGNTTIEGDTDIKGDSHLYKNLQVDGDTNIGGNTTIEGDTDIKGDSHLYKNLQVDGDTNIGGNTTIEGDTDIKGDSHLYKNLQVDGDTNIGGNTTIEGDTDIKGDSHLYKNLQVDGDTNIGGNTTIEQDLTVNGDTNIKGNTTIEKDLTVNGDSNIKGTTHINKDLWVDGDSNLKGDTHVGGDLQVDGDANVDGTLTADKVVTGDVLLPDGSLNRRLDDMDTRMNKVGANAAALAGLHYHDYRPGQKFNMAMGVGNYRNKTAMAIGGQYHFDRNVSMNVGATFGSGENMVAGGLTFSFGTPKSEYQKDNDALRRENNDLAKRLAKLEKWAEKFSLIDAKKSAFPDIPNDHWARNSVETLKGNGFVEGYPDGEFKGDRRMSRYEYAQMLFRALSRGAKVERSHLQEFAPELRQVEADEKAKKAVPSSDNTQYIADIHTQKDGQAYNKQH